jgi:hypothetical protein
MGYLDGQIEAITAALAEWGVAATHTPRNGGTVTSLSVEVHPIKLDPGQSLDDRIIQKNDGEWRVKCKKVQGVSFSGPGQTAEVVLIKFAVSDLATVQQGDIFVIDSASWVVI